MNAELRLLDSIACPCCGCVCDDLEIGFQGEQLATIEHACPLAEEWYREQLSRTAPACRIRGAAATLAEALDFGLELLRQSRFPLISGLSDSSTAGQRAACHLADLIGAAIDPIGDLNAPAATLALQRVGQSTSSLGEVRQRADLVVIWGADPVTTQPRFLERYALPGDGEFVEQQGRTRRLVVVSPTRSATSERADLHLMPQPGEDFEILWALRGLLRGLDLGTTPIGGLPVAELQLLAELLQQCRYGAIFFGTGLTTGTALPHQNVEALFSLVTELQAHTRCVVHQLRPFGDRGGADELLTWQTGYPGSIGLHRGYPVYGPGEFSTAHLLARQEVDLALFVGTTGIPFLSTQSRSGLQQTPTIILSHTHDWLPPEWGLEPDLFIPVAAYGIDLPGSTTRMDHISLPLRPLRNSNPASFPADGEILDHWRRQIQPKAT